MSSVKFLLYFVAQQKQNVQVLFSVKVFSNDFASDDYESTNNYDKNFHRQMQLIRLRKRQQITAQFQRIKSEMLNYEVLCEQQNSKKFENVRVVNFASIQTKISEYIPYFCTKHGVDYEIKGQQMAASFNHN